MANCGQMNFQFQPNGPYVTSLSEQMCLKNHACAQNRASRRSPPDLPDLPEIGQQVGGYRRGLVLEVRMLVTLEDT